jgi:hypothetical protein
MINRWLPSVPGLAGPLCTIRAGNQTLIFGMTHVENVKVIPTFRINFLNFPWQLLGASGPAGFTRLSCIVTKFM